MSSQFRSQLRIWRETVGRFGAPFHIIPFFPRYPSLQFSVILENLHSNLCLLSPLGTLCELYSHTLSRLESVLREKIGKCGSHLGCFPSFMGCSPSSFCLLLVTVQCLQTIPFVSCHKFQIIVTGKVSLTLGPLPLSETRNLLKCFHYTNWAHILLSYPCVSPLETQPSRFLSFIW